MPIKAHILKTDPDVFKDLMVGAKTFEIRKDDRNYEVEDFLILRCTKYSGLEMKEGKPLEYNDKTLVYQVSHLIRIKAHFGQFGGNEAPAVIMSLQFNSMHSKNEIDFVRYFDDTKENLFINLETGESNIPLE